MISDTRLYGAAIALASGLYSVLTSTDAGMGMMPTDWVMLLVGVVVIGHGIALLTPLVEGLGRASGALMIVWAAVMLANQALSTMPGSAMMSWDGGMVALALLMLVSGVIMSRRPTAM